MLNEFDTFLALVQIFPPDAAAVKFSVIMKSVGGRSNRIILLEFTKLLKTYRLAAHFLGNRALVC